MAGKSFSVVIPTYSGQETVAMTLKSIVEQSSAHLDYELIIIQDGPNQKLEQVVRGSLETLDFGRTRVKYHILTNNYGRFRARIEGAKLAKNKYLLFIDDRVAIAPDFFPKLTKIRADLMIGSAIEVNEGSTNLISDTLYFLRRWAYGSKSGDKFKDYYIDQTNFESSPKGTASLFVNKQLFLKACEQLAKQRVGTASRFFNEDTGLMRVMINDGHKILRTSQLKIYYYPRTGFKEAAVHLYSRGPRFVDYYMNPRSKFFPILVSCYLSLAVAVLLLIIGRRYVGHTILALAVFDIVVAVSLGRQPRHIIELIFGLPLVILLFIAGIGKGTLIKILAGFRSA